MITDLNTSSFSDEQKKIILEWFAYKLWNIFIKSGYQDGCRKYYDPLDIELKNKIAHSYVFDFLDGGRHHPFKDLSELEEMLEGEMYKFAEWANKAAYAD